jgi:hypothetical protein
LLPSKLILAAGPSIFHVNYERMVEMCFFGTEIGRTETPTPRLVGEWPGGGGGVLNIINNCIIINRNSFCL